MMQETNNMARSSVVPKGNETIQKQSIFNNEKSYKSWSIFFLIYSRKGDDCLIITFVFHDILKF